MSRYKAVIQAGIMFLAAAIAAAGAAAACSAGKKAAEFDFTVYEHSCDHTAYTDTYDALDSAKSGVVRVLEAGEEKNLSTAFAIGKADEPPRYFLTNLHSVKNGGEIFIFTDNMAQTVIEGGRILLDYRTDNGYTAKVKATDEKFDIALLETDVGIKEVTPLKILDADEDIIQGEELYGLCFPVSEDVISYSDGYKKALYADKERITVLKGESAQIFEGQEDFMHLKMELSGGCSGSPVVLKNGTAAAMVRQGNFSIIIDPVQERDIYEPAGNGTAVKAADLAAFLERNGINFEKGGIYAEAGCVCSVNEVTDNEQEKNAADMIRLLKNTEILLTLLFGALNVLGCAVIFMDDSGENDA